MSISDIVTKKPLVGWVLFFGTLLLVFLVGLLTASVQERRTEATILATPKNDLAQWESDNEKWGVFYPRQYQSWKATLEGDKRTFYNGNAHIDMVKEDPRLVILWAGYAFSKDYYQSRGHANAVTDVYNTLRTGAPMQPTDGPQPGTCWTCKSPDVPRLMSQVGPAEFYKKTWAHWGPEVRHAIGCADCHDPASMRLRISRPALIEAWQRQGKDIKNASHQEMRSLVCAQCHVEYFFKGEGKYLTFPWDRGLSVDEIEQYYDQAGFKDWVHGISKAPMLKAQHPDYEVYLKGIHGQRGVACADCHMPYKSEGGIKYSDHHVQSPLLNINASCQNCHRESEETLKTNVFERQQKNFELRLRLEDLLVQAHFEAKKAWEVGATEEEMGKALRLIRQSQWRWDFASAGHGNSFHAPLEIARMLGNGIDRAQEARIELTKVLLAHNQKDPVPYPDIETKEKAQALIGLDMKKLEEEKKKFLSDVIPSWKQGKHYGVDGAAAQKSSY